MNSSLQIRNALEADVEVIHAMICELAEYEKMSDAVVSTPDSLREALFAEPKRAEAVVADWDGEPVAFALYFHNYSTFTGKLGLYLEDVYVRSTHRKKGIGKALLVTLAQIARERDCARFEWAVLDWNENAIEFYESLGADVLPDWRIVRLSQDGISRLADAS